MKSQARLDTLMKSLARLPRGIDIAKLLTPHESMLPVQCSLDNTVTDGFGHNVLGALLATQVQANADVAERDAAVAKRHHPDTGLDDILAKTEDEGVCVITPEDVAMLRDNVLKRVEVADADSTDKLEVWVQRLLHGRLPEYRTLGDVAHQQLNNE
jgi:hypothetical protein